MEWGKMGSLGQFLDADGGDVRAGCSREKEEERGVGKGGNLVVEGRTWW